MLGCSPEEPAPRADKMPRPTIEQVLTTRTDAWLTLPGVIGTAMGSKDDIPCIMIYVTRRTDTTEKKILTEAAGYPVVFKALDEH